MYTYLESWFRSSKKNLTTPRPNTVMMRPNSESDIGGETDDNEIASYDQYIERLNDEEFMKQFERLLNDMNLNEDKKEPLRKLPMYQRKSMLLMHYKGSNNESRSGLDKPHQYVEMLQRSKALDLSPSKILSCVESLRVALTSNTLTWVHEFGTNGMVHLYEVLNLTSVYPQKFEKKVDKIQTECLRCIIKFNNNTEGLKAFLKHDDWHRIVTKCIDYDKPNVSVTALQILAALCLVNDESIRGAEKTLSALTSVSEERNMNRFKPIVDCIAQTDNLDLWSFCLQYINALLSEIEDFEFRVHLRNEIARIGLSDQMVKLKAKIETNPNLKTQYDVFEREKDEDADEFHSRFENIRVDMDDIQDCFEVLKNLTLDTPSEPYFLSILQHLLFIRDDIYIRPAYYKLIEECVSQIILQKSGLDPDFSMKPIDVDLQPLLEELKERPDMVEKKKYDDLHSQLEKALSEKEEALAKLAIAEGKMSGVVSSGKLDPTMLNNMNNALSTSSGGPVPPPPPPPPCPGGMMPPPPPPPPNMPGPPPPPMPGMGGPPPPPMPGMGGPPPPPMPGIGGPPPPPLGMVPLPGMVQLEVLPFGLKPKKKWDVSGPLKRANWKTIIPHKMSEKSFWVKVQEEKLASNDILDGLAERFSSKPITKKTTDTLSKEKPTGTLKKSRELKVLDGKSAQNILILLNGSLKHTSYDKIKKCLLQCDDQVVTESVLEGLIQYLPPPDQLSKLQQYKDSYDELTEAEQFCVKVSDIKRLLPRLKSMKFKQQYTETVEEVMPDIVVATAACEEVKNSSKFARLLELVLLVGNYMNTGSRNAQAFGFEINFLTKLSGTKDVQNNRTLLHYIVETAENKFPEILNFYDEMSHVDKASRVSLDTIQKTLKQMENHIKNLQTDIANNRVPMNEDDKFIEVMEEFANKAQEKCDIMQNMFKKMDSLYSDLADYYVFDKQKYTLEEFFTDLKKFKDDFIQAKKDNEKEREIEEKNRKAKLAREKAEIEKQERDARKKTIIDMNPEQTQEGVMDSLLEALKTGSAFSREQKRKRNVRPVGAERRAQLVRSRSRTNVIGARELRGEIVA